MRRETAGGGVEGMLLTGHWLLSGYGLRAWRALSALVALILGATVFVRDRRSRPHQRHGLSPGPPIQPSYDRVQAYGDTWATPWLGPADKETYYLR